MKVVGEVRCEKRLVGGGRGRSGGGRGRSVARWRGAEGERGKKALKRSSRNKLVSTKRWAESRRGERSVGRGKKRVGPCWQGSRQYGRLLGRQSVFTSH